jgi:hypothetical protein
MEFPRTTVKRDNKTYRLLGDPATRLRRPLALDSVGFAGLVKPGNPATLQLGGLPANLQNGMAVVTFERPLTQANDGFEEIPSDPDSPAGNAARQRNFERMNHRVLATVSVEIRDGKPVGPVTLPATLERGRYDVRVAVIGDTEVATGMKKNLGL